MNKKKLFIIVSILAAIGLVVMLFMLPKPKTNNSAKHETSTENSSSKESSKKNDKKDDKKDNKQSDKKDSKKDDKKEDTSTTSTETPATPTTGTTSTDTQNNNNSTPVTTTPSTNTTPAAPAPQPIYQTIHHEEVGHWETQVIAEAWDQPIYERKIIGNNTGTVYASTLEFAGNTNGDEGYHVGDVQVGTTHHDAVTQQVWVVDQYAWDETIIVGYR
ncbi:hypothetical protein [Solobacterium sp.]|uniref:hypothetical protein n=1 Tax=Solobacterium sp. TaxID=2060878 RepID=UPI001CB12098|nr:hypothetical protein [Solobacterium sp.]MBF1086388.1 hypothetical protein [Solobacterium sp.]MBF1103715.1 hypothetical protein [Solobacterium sp.]